jgi:hypothetical protein
MRALLLAALLLGACRTTYHEGATITSRSGQRLCAKHRTPLVALRAYEAPPGMLIHDANRWYYHMLDAYYPNHIPEYITLNRVWVFRRPTTIWYCPACEKEFLDALRVSDEATAIKYAKDALPSYGGGGVPTKGPYEASFEKGIWTVRCFLQDGRRAIIKIREDGTAIFSDFHK